MDPVGLAAPAAALVEGIAAGDLRAVARAISLVETGGAAADALAAVLHGRAGRALSVGVTGAPGAGKSTLVSQLVGRYRQAGQRVGVLAIDPTSPFTGGALLGDRVRMQAHALDAGVFIRSMATRGHLGGLSAATVAAADVLDAAGFDVILIETVGVGQDEVDVARIADVCVVVMVPGAGDDVQAMKAGVMEIADVFVVNKADREGADRAAAAIEQALALDDTAGAARPAVMRVVATTGHGVDELVEAIAACGRDEPARRTRRLRRAEWRLTDTLARTAVEQVRREVCTDTAGQELVSAIDARHDSPYAAARRLLDLAGATGHLDHVGVATVAIDDSLAFFADAMNLSAGAPEVVPAQGVRVRFVDTGDARIELIEAVDEHASFAESLRRRGPGLHHIALRVDDLAATLDRLAARGVRLVDRQGRPGAHGTTVAFIHPSSTQGVLIELVERRRG